MLRVLLASMIAALWLAIPSQGFALQCDGVTCDLPKEMIVEFAAPIAKQLGVERVEILKTYTYGAWHIIYVLPHQEEYAYLFYSGDPRENKYITTAPGGGYACFEHKEARDWIIARAPGIPPQLATCFAWQVTKARLMPPCVSPCDGINRELDKLHDESLSKSIANYVKVASVKVVQLFALDNWSIVYVYPYGAEPTFIFFSGNPLTNDPIATWSGFAVCYEENKIHDWVLKNVPDIPEKLARCFSWHVAMDRDL